MKEIYYHSGFRQPVVNWRIPGQTGAFHGQTMQPQGPGRKPQESLWLARIPVEGERLIEFFIADGEMRDPSRRYYQSRTQLAFLQDGEIFSYHPAPQVEEARRAYQPSQPHQIYSASLKEWRTYRVYLPRGYRQHLQRRYPVVYLQDGQNIFENGPYGSWRAQRAIDRGVRRGEIEELLVVAVDHGQGRYQDYVPSEDGGDNQRYARFLSQELKPHIDRTFRSLTGPQDTALIGSSLGGVAALSIAWDHFHKFAKAASLSGSWWLKNFQERMLAQPRRPLKIYVDSGNAGPYNDCFQDTLELRHQLEHSLGYRPGQDLMHLIADRHSHSEAAWGQRLILALRFLFPALDRPGLGVKGGVPEWRAALPRPA